MTASTTPPMPWPERSEWPTSAFTHPAHGTLTIIDEVGFAQARAEAALSRLRLLRDAADAVLTETRREFAYGELADVDTLQDMLFLCDLPPSEGV